MVNDVLGMKFAILVHFVIYLLLLYLDTIYDFDCKRRMERKKRQHIVFICN